MRIKKNEKRVSIVLQGEYIPVSSLMKSITGVIVALTISLILRIKPGIFFARVLF
jgi:hypothetical protein